MRSMALDTFTRKPRVSGDYPNRALRSSSSSGSSRSRSQRLSETMDRISEEKDREEVNPSRARLARQSLSVEQLSQIEVVLKTRTFRKRSDVDRFMSQMMGQPGHTPFTRDAYDADDLRLQKMIDAVKCDDTRFGAGPSVRTIAEHEKEPSCEPTASSAAHLPRLGNTLT